jgi:hypothetical protein
MIGTALVTLALASVPNKPAEIRDTGTAAAKIWCNKQKTTFGITCVVQESFFSAKEDAYYMGGVFLLTIHGDPAVLTMRYRSGNWYYEDISVLFHKEE